MSEPVKVNHSEAFASARVDAKSDSMNVKLQRWFPKPHSEASA